MVQARIPTAEIQTHKPTFERQEKHEKKPQDASNALLYAFYLILDSVKIQRDSADMEANKIRANAEAQSKLNDEMARINYEQVGKDGKIWSHVEVDWVSPEGGGSYWKWTSRDPTSNELSEMNLKNQQISKRLNYIENKTTIERQNAQVDTTNLNTTVNTAQQSVQIDGSLTNILTSLTQQISQI